MPDRRDALAVLALGLFIGGMAGCTATEDDTVTPVEIPAASLSTIVLAWSEVGMHALNATYDQGVLHVPYSSLRAQVIRRGDPPQLVTDGIVLEYRLVGNTFSYGKTTASPVREYAPFWDNSLDLFGIALAPDTGLNFVDPDVHNGLTGTMLLKGDRFQADGIPAVPVNDAGTWDPYQVAEIIVKDASSGTEIVRTRVTVPTSDEVNCAKCHGKNDVGSVLEEHDEDMETTLVDEAPVLCAECHGSPALGKTGPGSSDRYLSDVIHGFHSTTSAACYDCHPGETTLGNRSTDHTASNGNCTTCHGSAAEVSSSIMNGRIPWVNEPKCARCHTFVAEVDTGTTLYTNATGHHGVSCAACHGTAHAQVPSNKDIDHDQALQYQNKALPLGSCRVCHKSSKGGGLMGIVSAHGGSEPTACTVCHTGPVRTTNPQDFPHRFQHRNRGS